MSTANDEAVLQTILSPLLSTCADDETNVKHDTGAPPTPVSDEEMRARQLEKDGVAAAEAGQYDVALAAFNSAIELCPTRASCYNNRAQLYRLQHKNDGLFARSCRAACTLDTDALHDVDCAVELSGGTGPAATQAYTQRALLHRLAGRDEQAKADFERAAAGGCVFAKNQLIALNPYAAMCNKMLVGVFDRLRRGEPEDTDSAA